MQFQPASSGIPPQNYETQAPQKKTIRSTLVSRNVTISGHRTSVRLEPEMWSGLSEISRRERASLHEICTAVALRKAENTSLTAAIRVFVMAYFRAASTEDGHAKAGHGYGLALNATSSGALPAHRQGSSSPSPLIVVHGKSNGQVMR